MDIISEVQKLLNPEEKQLKREDKEKQAHKMDIKYYKKPKSPTVITGFPGFGLVGTISTEYLLEHLSNEPAGKILFYEMPAIAAIHDNKIVEPFGFFYNKEYNIIIIHAISSTTGFEWELADIIMKIARELGAKEIISLEGVGSNEQTSGTRSFYFASDEKSQQKLKKLNVSALNEGIIVGVSGALLLKHEEIPITCIFSETHSKLPDSNAAAKIIETLDKYLDLDVDYKPLLAQAEKFEEKLKNILKKGQEATELSEQKRMSYVG